MARNYILRRKTQQEIDERVGERVLARLGNPEPPLILRVVRDLLSLDLTYFRKDDPSLADEVISRMRMASKQIIRRPMLFFEAVAKFDLRALYLPEQQAYSARSVATRTEAPLARGARDRPQYHPLA